MIQTKMSNTINSDSFKVFSELIFRAVWYKHGLLENAFRIKDFGKNNEICMSANVANAVICKQYVYRDLYEGFFIRNFPTFMLTRRHFRLFAHAMCLELCRNPECAFYDKFLNTCAFLAEMYLFCSSRALDVDINIIPSLLTEIFFEPCKEECVTKTFNDIAENVKSLYGEIYKILEPYIFTKTPCQIIYNENLFNLLNIDSITAMSNERKVILKELCAALLRNASKVRVENLRDIEVYPLVPVKDHELLQAIITNQCSFEDDIVEKSEDILESLYMASKSSKSSARPDKRVMKPSQIKSVTKVTPAAILKTSAKSTDVRQMKTRSQRSSLTVKDDDKKRSTTATPKAIKHISREAKTKAGADKSKERTQSAETAVGTRTRSKEKSAKKK